MATNFEKIKRCDQRTRDLVNHFIRTAQTLLQSNDNPYYNIPPLVFALTLLYFWNPEYFTVHGNYIKLNETKDIMEFTEDYDNSNSNTAYGNIVITKNDTGKFIWTFKIVKPHQEAIIAIGIDSSNKKFVNNRFYHTDNKNMFYGYQSYGDEIFCDNGKGARIANVIVKKRMDYIEDYGCIYSDQCNEIKMKLDMDQKILRYYVNGKDQGIAFENICFDNDEEYSLCICIDDKMTIQLMKFECN